MSDIGDRPSVPFLPNLNRESSTSEEGREKTSTQLNRSPPRGGSTLTKKEEGGTKLLSLTQKKIER